MNRARLNFGLTLVLFLGWVGVLALMARFSAERPRAGAAVQVPR